MHPHNFSLIAQVSIPPDADACMYTAWLSEAPHMPVEAPSIPELLAEFRKQIARFERMHSHHRTPSENALASLITTEIDVRELRALATRPGGL